MSAHRFSAAAFRKRFLPRLLLALAPSLALDLVALAQAVTGAPVTRTAGGAVDWATLLWVLLGNALLLKSVPVAVYLAQRRRYRRSSVEHTHGVWIYRLRRLDLTIEPADYLPYVEHRLERIREVRWKGGDLYIQGQIEKTWLDDSGRPVRQAVCGELTIPACFTDMAGLANSLTRDIQ